VIRHGQTENNPVDANDLSLNVECGHHPQRQLRSAGVERGVRGRLWAVLLREIDGQPSDTDGTWSVHLTHEALAERAGVSRPKLSGALKTMEREGVLRLGKRVITVVQR
jgi:CRP-like cAMP-binding protein